MVQGFFGAAQVEQRPPQIEESKGIIRLVGVVEFQQPQVAIQFATAEPGVLLAVLLPIIRSS
jgi:hypothetical protein